MIYGYSFSKPHWSDIPMFLFIMLQVALGLFQSSKFVYWFFTNYLPAHIHFS